jgi:ubiquinone/menaquinone biosynthesis C-methylase UbiE
MHVRNARLLYNCVMQFIKSFLLGELFAIRLKGRLLRSRALLEFNEMLDKWVTDALADPISKLPAAAASIGLRGDVVDARRYLKNTAGFRSWRQGQDVYEAWDKRTIEDYRTEIDGVAPVYEHIKMSGRVLDVGGGAGTVRHFLPRDTSFVSVDPFLDYMDGIPPQKIAAYPCLGQHLNFIAACAEFLPFQAETFDWVHMRSMLDHVQSPDLALMEARRVLRRDGKLVIGLYVDGGKSGRRTLDRELKEIVRALLVTLGVNRFKDHHTFHPTFANLSKIITDNGFSIEDVYWQPQWNDTVCYITACLTSAHQSAKAPARNSEAAA